MAGKTKKTPNRKPIFVKIVRLGDEVKEYALNGTRNVKSALEVAGLSSSSADRIRINGKPSTLRTALKNKDVLTVAGKIEGAL